MNTSVQVQLESAQIAGPGFINFIIYKQFWIKLIKKILKDNERFGFKNIGKGKTVNIEFVSANPTGPLHVGHTRGAIFGDTLANLLKNVGFSVTRESVSYTHLTLPTIYTV